MEADVAFGIVPQTMIEIVDEIRVVYDDSVFRIISNELTVHKLINFLGCSVWASEFLEC